MVKQGKFAQFSRMKHQKNILKYQTAQKSKAISNEKIAEFLTVRYHLVNQKQTTWVVQETMLRFLNILIDQFGTQPIWDLAMGLEQSVRAIGNQVPWQFYYVLSLHKTNFIKFLKREVPAIPLENKLIILEVSSAVFDEIIAQHLALNWFSMQYHKQPEKLRQLQKGQISELKKSFLDEKGVAWQAVEMLYSSQAIAYDVDSTDLQTHKWITALQQIEINF